MTLADAVFLTLSIGLSAAVAAWVLRPLWRPDAADTVEGRPPPALLMRRRAAVLDLRDLDADLAVGRISTAEHARRRSEVLRQGALAMAEADRWRAERTTRLRAAAQRLEADVAAARVRGGHAEPRCAECGTTARAGARFCAACGSPLPIGTDGGRDSDWIGSDAEG